MRALTSTRETASGLMAQRAVCISVGPRVTPGCPSISLSLHHCLPPRTIASLLCGMFLSVSLSRSLSVSLRRRPSVLPMRAPRMECVRGERSLCSVSNAPVHASYWCGAAPTRGCGDRNRAHVGVLEHACRTLHPSRRVASCSGDGADRGTKEATPSYHEQARRLRPA